MTIFTGTRQDLRATAATPAAVETKTKRRRNKVWAVVISMALILGFLGYASWSNPQMYKDLFAGYCAALIGVAVGAGELISRYRDAPFLALVRNTSSLYMGVNALASAVTYVLINNFDLTFGIEVLEGEPTTSEDVIQVLVAGFAAMAIFRSSVFLARIGDQENVGIGPAIVLQTVLTAADAGIDRESAQGRALDVRRIMNGVDANRAHIILPEFCARLLQSSLLEGEFTVVKNKVKEVMEENKTVAVGRDGKDVTEIAPNSKAYLIGLIIMNYMGVNVLAAGVETLGSEIKKPPELHLADITQEVSDAEAQEVEVHYQISAEDAGGNEIEPICDPPSGTKFQVGQTKIVSCEATDPVTGLKAADSFEVRLFRTPGPAVDKKIDTA